MIEKNWPPIKDRMTNSALLALLILRLFEGATPLSMVVMLGLCVYLPTLNLPTYGPTYLPTYTYGSRSETHVRLLVSG